MMTKAKSLALQSKDAYLELALVHGFLVQKKSAAAGNLLARLAESPDDRESFAAQSGLRRIALAQAALAEKARHAAGKPATQITPR
jgi:hypothetical protein